MLRDDAEGAGGHHLNQAPRMDAPGLDSQTLGKDESQLRVSWEIRRKSKPNRQTTGRS
jgi:hypothetical protein